MKLGLGLYRHDVTAANLDFARQAGATQVVIHLVDYFRATNLHGDQPIGGSGGWGVAGTRDELWTLEQLLELKALIEAHDLAWYSIENLDPGHWHDILLDGPERDAQVADIQGLIRVIGAAGIPVLGYNFSLAGVAGRMSGPFARGGATGSGMEGIDDTPIPNGMVWNMTYDPGAPAGSLATVDRDELWGRYRRFLGDVLPVAEEAGVRLAAHPDDPPVPMIRSQPRLLYQPSAFRTLAGLHPSRANQIDFCLGTVGEMRDPGMYEAIDEHSAAGRIAYVHFRNVRGKVPSYRETFIDEGDTDMLRVLEILHRNGFDGVLVPDHAPQMSCAAPWHAGMSFAMGYMAAGIEAVRRGLGETGPALGDFTISGG